MKYQQIISEYNQIIGQFFDSESTPRIQEAHILLLHLLAQEIEDRI